MAWLWRRDIDDEKRTPGFIYAIKSAFSRKNVDIEKAGHELRLFGIGPGQTVLDFGSGPGHYALAAARVVGDGGFVHALDLHPKAMELVERKASEMNLPNIETIYSDLHTGLDDESVDAVILFDVMRGRSDIKSLLGELHRILKPGGSVHVRDTGLKAGRLEELMVKDGLFRLKGILGGVLKYTKVEGEFHEI
ncbi:MAG: methyltransferase domain-containing protein [Candidatus Aenigmarchaeota archaeon]|nr:methyltransferase domain-containing protein [Candidatus Aenigmarchaeota archaeon]